VADELCGDLLRQISEALFVKSPNAIRVGGGPVAAEDGDFDTDGVAYKVRHCFGGTLME
jgi:hypothetical protein